MQNIKTITFNEGEKRELTATIRSEKENDVVVIASAKFELKKFSGDVVQSGICEISDSGNEATIFLDLAEKGSYELETEFNVGREVIKKKRIVKVL